MSQLVVTAKAFLNRPLGRYILIGSLVYLLELVVIFAAQHNGASAVVAVALSFWLGLIVSFVLTKFVTFKDKRTHHKILLPQLSAVTVLVLFNFSFTLLLTRVLSPQLPAVATRTLGLGITTIWNFYLYRTRIFKTNRPVLD
jgi:putative flippase GtrA